MSATRAEANAVLGRRVGAALIDLVLMIVLMVLVGLALGETDTSGSQASVSLGTAGSLLWIALVLLYYGATEAATGQTLGKRLLGIRVVRLDGARPTAGKIAVRTVFRLVDALPIGYIVGLIVVVSTGDRQRVGDLVAGTTVVGARPRG